MRHLAATLVLASCSFSPPSTTGGASDGGRDGTDFRDAPPISSDGCDTFSTQFDSCTVELKVPVSIDVDRIYDTDTHVLADFPSRANPRTLDSTEQTNIIGKAGTINVLLATTFEIKGGKTLRVVGTKAFGVVANQAITIGGALDASSQDGLGAGAWDATGCATASPLKPANHGLDGNHGGAPGGGGGAFQGDGGDGGDSDSNETPASGAPGGTKIAKPAGPRGGCPGGAGSSSTNNTGAGGAGGGAGGAIYLVSELSIKVNGGGTINAGGGGGGGGENTDGGGGGGGSGGMILLEAPSLTIDGKVGANGGAGGGAAGGNTAGQRGGGGLAGNVGATAGNGSPNGTDGAPGSVAANPDGPDNDLPRPTAGGGGGGGAAGFIAVFGATPTYGGGAQVSPVLSAWP